MAFDVYPIAPNPPLSVPANLSSVFFPFNERKALTQIAPGFETDVMFIRLVKLGSSCPAPGGVRPQVTLKVGGGPDAVLPPMPPALPTAVVPVSSATKYVADAQMLDESNNVYLIKVTFQLLNSPSIPWELKIQNNDGAERFFTWVVADSDVNSQQPWIDVPTILDFDNLAILVGESVNHTLTVTNKGTGPLEIEDTTTTPLGAGFKIVAPLPGPILPNNCGDVMITFDAPTTIGEKTFDYTIKSGDKVISAGHHKTVHLKATARKLEVVMVLDGSGSMSFTPDGAKHVPNVSLSDSRWGIMAVAAEQFLDLLTKFAGDKGNIAMVEFPDISLSPVPDISAKVVQPKIAIPSNVQSLKDKLQPPNPVPKVNIGNTPIGRGIGEAMGSTAAGTGQFEGGTSKSINRRWMVLLSDGAHNRGNIGTSDHPSFYYGLASTATSFRGKNVKVFAAAYGDERVTTWPADHRQMEQLRDNSDGAYSNAGLNDLNTDAVSKALRNAITDGLALDPSDDPGGTLTSGKPEARHAISVLPYDTKVAFVINWGTFDAKRVTVTLLTPTCELITPAVAMSDPNLSYDDHPRYAIYTIQHDYLRNAGNPGSPRYGDWTLIIAGNSLGQGDQETYEFEVITQSRLKMQLEFDRARYYAGDTIGLSARLTLDGKPIPQANVYWTLDAPGNSAINWLAQSKVSDAEYQKASEEFAFADVTPLAIKQHALTSKGILFTPFKLDDTTTMTDPENQGVYSATTSETRVQGPYNFRVTALGETEGNTRFRREKQVQAYLTARPLPDFTLWDFIYRQVFIDRRPWFEAKVRVWPRDPFGNIVLVEPEVNPLISLGARGGEFVGPLQSNLDGSYTRTLRYDPAEKPTFSLQVGEEMVFDSRPITSVTELVYTDQVLEFKLGLEAEPGANQHRDPQAILGEVTTREEGQFLSLGGLGSVVVGVEQQAILAHSPDDVTIFVQLDEDLKPYRVEALNTTGEGRWVELGVSTGVTQSFSLRQAGLRAARAIRVTDASGRVRDSDFKPSPTPGVSILGVGFRQVGQKPEVEPGPKPDEWQGCRGLFVSIIRQLLRTISKAGR